MPGWNGLLTERRSIPSNRRRCPCGSRDSDEQIGDTVGADAERKTDNQIQRGMGADLHAVETKRFGGGGAFPSLLSVRSEELL